MIPTLAGEDLSAATVGQSAGLLSLRLKDAKTQQPSGAMSSPPVVSLEEVAWHDHITDCWVVVYDQVYNITDFLLQHPGGEEILLEYAGRDATLAFRGIGHSQAMFRALGEYLVGVLPESECIFCSKDGKMGPIKLAAVY